MMTKDGRHGPQDRSRVDDRNDQRHINEQREKADIAREYGNKNIGRQLDDYADKKQAELDDRKKSR
jgi:hypothetical protein